MFERFLPVFDLEPTADEGETHEQYAAFKEYCAALEERLLQFAAEEGYSGEHATEFLQALHRAIEEDKAKAEQELQHALAAMREQSGEHATEFLQALHRAIE